MVVPPDLSPPPRGLVPYPLAPTVAVEGRSFRPRGVRLSRTVRKTNYLAGDDGVALVSPGSPGMAVLFSECTAALRWPDGSRGLWSADGFYLEVTPAEIVHGSELVELIDERVPSEVVVRMEPDEEDRLAATTAVIDSKVKRRWVNREELAALNSLLVPDEELRTLADASIRWNLGVLAVTNRRLLFLSFDKVKLELRAEDIVDVSARSDAIEVTARDAVHKLTDIAPKGRAEELADEIRKLSPRSSEESA